MTTRRWIAGCAVVALIIGSGCQSINFDKPAWTWPWPRQEPVAQVCAVWADGLVFQANAAENGAIMPNFAGRVYFFNSAMDRTLKADGALVVSLYDNTQAETPNAPPKEFWNLTGRDLAMIEKSDAVGIGYNLMLPWSTYTPEVSSVTLVVKYTDPCGREFWSAPTTFPISTGAGPKVRPTTLRIEQSQRH
jgi:hypothetical protein